MKITEKFTFQIKSWKLENFFLNFDFSVKIESISEKFLKLTQQYLLDWQNIFNSAISWSTPTQQSW